MSYPPEIEALFEDLRDAEERIQEMTDRVVQEDHRDDDIPDVEIVETSHVQIRVWKSGPRDADGRHGDIIIEDLQAPIEVAQWLRSPQCRKNNQTRRRVYVWVDDDLVVNADSLPIPEDDDPVRSEIPARTADAGFSNLQAYQERLARAAKIGEEQLEAQLKVFQDQIDRAREFRDKEVSACYAAIEAARLRLAVELEREDAEIAGINTRRAVIHNERMAMAQDLNGFNKAMIQLKERMADTTPQPGDGIVDRFVGVMNAVQDPGVQRGLNGLLQMYFAAKQQG